MVCRNLGLLLAFALQIVSQVVASTTSYVSSNSGNQDDSTTVSELISVANEDNPLLIFRFAEYPILEAWMPYEGHVPYLTQFFNSDTRAYQEDFPIERLSTDENIEVFNLDDLTLSAPELLYNYHLKGKSIVVFNFEKANYDLASMDEFMESAFLLLSDSFESVENVVLNVQSSSDLERYSNSDAGVNKARVEGDVKDPKEAPGKEDTDVLSTIWTEGLLMCLIVSVLLLAILIVAISWMSSMDISYGALEKSTNPLKKTK